ncbi:MAG: transglutaminase family protein [Planctomycetes bacterium]|nr:transglutaminase family protein [Planctomycetota bacterium]
MNEPQGAPEPSSPSPAQIAATIALLGDDRGPVLTAARERLLRWGDAALLPLREGAECEHVRTRARCRALLRTIEVRDSLRRFGRLRIGRGGRGSAPALLEGAVLLASMVRTFVPGADELGRRLRVEANRLRREFAGRSLPTCARLLAGRLHDQIGLQGGNASVLELDHVLVDRVLHQGTGVPVTLSLIYLLVARWAGLSAAGVAMPDHFLVRLHGVRPVLVDPFHGGRSVTKADCARYLRSTGHDQVAEHLRDLTDREVLIHYLRALRRAAKYRAVPESQQTLGRALDLLETS